MDGRNRFSRVARVGRLALAPVLTNPHVILTVADNGSGNPRYTTEAPHGLSPAATVAITGTTTYDGPAVNVDAVPSPTTFDSADFAFSVPFTGRATWS